jgi:hypothetical protein
MCHLCRKFEALQGDLDSTAYKPISSLISRLHNKIEPRLGHFWLERHEQTVKLRGFLSKLHGAAPIAALRHMLDAVDNELEHIRKHMQDHSIPHSTGQLNVLKETIAPSSSVSVQAAMRYLQEEREKRSTRTRPADRHEGEGAKKAERFNATEAGNLHERPGRDINPPAAQMERSVGMVDEWLAGGEGGAEKRRRHRHKHGDGNRN